MLICLDQRTGAGCGAPNRDGAQHCAQCGMSLRFALQLQNPGATIGNYRIIQLLGHGGFGAVYEAEDTRQPGLRIALKESFDANSVRAFQSEFVVLRNLQHPNLPRYYEMFEYQGNGYLVMELVPGQSLQDVLDGQPGQPLLESQVLGYAMQVCDALVYLHSQTPLILHRDVKPANIRITPAGLIKLVDFGLLKQGTGTTQSSKRAGTPGYAPIEQYGSTGQHTNQQSDIYSLGATLYHLLTGHPPAPAADRIVASPDPLLSVRQVNPRISQTVADAVMKAAHVFQQNRFADVLTMKQALMGVATRQPNPLPMMPQQNPQQTRMVTATPKPPLAVSLVVAFLAITGVPIVIWGGIIGIISAILMWFGRKWGRRIGILYLEVALLGIGAGEISGFYVAYQQQCDWSSSGGCRWYYRTEPIAALAGTLAAILFTLGLSVLFSLFRDDVLDFFYPHHAPHAKWTNLCLSIVSIVAWAQILLGFWLIFPVALGFGLLYRKRWALTITRRLARVGTILGALAFLPGVVVSASTMGGFVLPIFAHLTFLVNGIAWYVLTRPGVDTQF